MSKITENFSHDSWYSEQGLNVASPKYRSRGLHLHARIFVPACI